MLLSDAKKFGVTEYYTYGEQIQTTAIFSIIICAPMGAILINSLFPRLTIKNAIEPTK
jgi:hypothetical protein